MRLEVEQDGMECVFETLPDDREVGRLVRLLQEGSHLVGGDPDLVERVHERGRLGPHQDRAALLHVLVDGVEHLQAAAAVEQGMVQRVDVFAAGRLMGEEQRIAEVLGGQVFRGIEDVVHQLDTHACRLDEVLHRLEQIPAIAHGRVERRRDLHDGVLRAEPVDIFRRPSREGAAVLALEGQFGFAGFGEVTLPVLPEGCPLREHVACESHATHERERAVVQLGGIDVSRVRRQIDLADGSVEADHHLFDLADDPRIVDAEDRRHLAGQIGDVAPHFVGEEISPFQCQTTTCTHRNDSFVSLSEAQ